MIPKLTAVFFIPVALQRQHVLAGSHEFGPLYAVREAQVLVVVNQDVPRRDLLERLHVQGNQRGLDDLHRSHVFRQHSASYDFQVPEVLQARKVLVVALNVQVPRDFLQSAEHF